MEVLPYTGIPLLRKLKVQGNASSDVEFLFYNLKISFLIIGRFYHAFPIDIILMIIGI